MTNSPGYEQAWHGEPQELAEVRDIALAQNPFNTLRMLYKCPAYVLVVVLCFLGAKDLSHGRSLVELGEFAGAIVFALRFLAVIFSFLTVMNWVASYWNTNLLTQWFMLSGTASTVLYLGTPGGGLPELKLLTGKLILATIGALVCEFAAILWFVRRRDAERIHRLKQLGQLAGLLSAVATALFVALQLGAVLRS